MKLAKQNKHSKKNRLSLLALEPRLVFDGAMAVTGAEDLTGKVLQSSVDGQNVLDRSADMAIAPAPASLEQAAAGVNFLQLRPGQDRQVEQAAKEVESKVVALLRSDNWAQQLFPIFSAGQTSMNDAWLASAQAFRDNVLENGLQVAVKVVSADVILGIDGAYAAQGPDGRPVIYLNQDRVALLGAEFATRVLLEETGHWIDNQINAAADTQGDEGERFADTLLNVQLSALNQARIATENDHLNLTIDGRDVQVEMAALMFNGQSYFAGITAKSGLSATGPDGQTAQLESNTLVIGNAIPGTRALFVSDPPDAAYYSGNNVRGTLYAIDANNNIVGKYYGEISRLIKIGSAPVSAQMYVYPTSDPNVTNINATTIIVDFYATAPTFNTGDIAKTSSDPVASALNSLLPANQPPAANPDTGFPTEAGGLNNATPGTNATGNVISGSDTDPNSTYVVDLVNNKVLTVQDTLTVTQVSNTGAGTSVTAAVPTGGTVKSIAPIAGLYGTLTMGVDGTYTYVVNNNNTAVQALRGTTNTLTDTYTYTVSDGKGGFSTTTLTITVRGANDNPLAKDDYNFAKESIEPTSTTQYTSTDALGQKATGNVLPNDTDVDAYGETKQIAGVLATATVSTVSTSLTLNFNSVPSNVSVGRYVWLDSDGVLNNVTGTLLKDAAGNPITVTAVTATTATLSGVPVNAQGTPIDLTPNMILGFSNNTAGASYSEAQIKDAGIAPSNTLRLNTVLTGQITVGMTLLGDSSIPAGTKVTGITYKADGTIDRITISNSIALSSATLTFSAETFPMTLTGQYGTLVLQQDGSYVYTPIANNPALNSGDMKVDAFRYTMRDAAGATSVATLYINVMGTGPSDPDANADTVNAGEAGGTTNGTPGLNPTGTGGTTGTGLLGNDTLGVNAPSGSTLSIVAAKTTATSPDLATSISGTGETAIPGLYGTVYLKTDGSYRYEVNNDNSAVQALRLSSDKLEDTFQYKITNGSGFNWSTFTATITGANDAPVATNDGNLGIVGQYQPVGNVLANDTDVDAGDTKKVTQIAFGNTLGGNPSSVTASSTYTSNYRELVGNYGTLRIGADGSYTYLVGVGVTQARLAELAALGTGQHLSTPDVFTYQVTDAGGLVSTATLTMNVDGSNDAPVNTLPTTVNAQEGSSYAFTGAGNIVLASDVDNNLASTTLSVTNGTLAVDITGATPFYQGYDAGVTPPAGTPQDGIRLLGGAILYFDRATTAGGNLTVTGNGTSNFTLYGSQAQVNAALASLVYTPTPGFVGTDTLKIESIDAEGLKDVDTVSMGVTSPALSVTGTTVNEASPYTLFTVSGKEGQYVKLSLEATGTGSGYATLGTDTSLTLQYFNGDQWVTYDAALNGGYVVMPSDGDTTSGENATLLVRVANVQDTANEGAETLKLVATNAAGIANATTDANPLNNGISTIKDDGTGSLFSATNTNGTPEAPGTNGLPARLDDDRRLTVSSVIVNEASPYATFTVTGANGQTVLLDLANASGTPSSDPTGGNAALGTTPPTLQYYNGTSWVDYDPSTPPIITSGTTLLVRVAINAEQDPALDGPETFNLVATNTGGTSGTGQATIKDDGTGSYFAYADNNTSTPLTAPSASALDDDRPLAVNSITVNEASPYATFTVTGVAGQWVSLALGNTAATTDVDATLGTDTGNAGTSVPLQYFNGSTWLDYTGGPVQIPTTGSTLLVRTAITNDPTFEGPETFTLTATNTGGSGAMGTATIKDDGTGSVFKYSTTIPGALLTTTDAGYPVLDDDRALTVSNVNVNEGSPYAVFTVTGPLTGEPDQKVLLSLANASGGAGYANLSSPALQYYEGGVWKTYNASNPPVIAGGTSLLVRVDITAERDTALDGPETFNLVATNTGGTSTPLTQGIGTIRDDGQGAYFAADNSTATSAVPTGVVLDDDRVLSVSNVDVNEASPYAVFTVTGPVAGQPAQKVYLSVINASGNGTPDAAGDAAMLGTPSLEYYDTGSSQWKPYSASTPPTVPAGGSLLVRVGITAESDTPFDGPETFNLVATNSGGTPSSTTGNGNTGLATIYDNGTGGYFAANNTSGVSDLPTGVVLDDDRPLTVGNVNVNETAGYAVFTVGGVAGQQVQLALQSTGSGVGYATLSGPGADIGSTLQYFNPTLNGGVGDWVNYTAGDYVAIPTGNSLQVRVAINRDTTTEPNETFYLAVTNAGGTTTRGTGTITDYTPPAIPLTASATEAGGVANGTAGSDATGNLVTANNPGTQVLTVSDVKNAAGASATAVTGTIGGVSYTAVVTGTYGKLYVNTASGAWYYEVLNNDPAVQALLANSGIETFQYTLKDSADATASNTLTITVAGRNDAPVAKPDYNTAKESLAGTTGFTGVTAYSTANDPTFDRLGYKAVGNVLPNDTDVDAGDSMLVNGIFGEASVASKVDSTGLTQYNFTTSSGWASVKTDDYAYYYTGATYARLMDVNGNHVRIVKDSTSFRLSAIPTQYWTASGNVSIDLATATTPRIGFDAATSTTVSGNVKYAEVSSTTSSGSSTVTLGAGFTGTIAVGMSVTGTNVPSDTKVLSIQYDVNGNITGVVLSKPMPSVTNSTILTFSAAAGTEITGKHGTLVLNANGSYTYTPFVDDTALSEGQSAQEVFHYTISDAGNLKSTSTLTITVLGSGQNDPNARSDTNSVTEAQDSLSATTTTGNVLGATGASAGDVTDTFPGSTGPLVVTAVRSSSVSADPNNPGQFVTIASAAATAPAVTSQTVQGLYGSLILRSDGSYTYTLDNANASVQGLNVGQTLTEQFQYEVQNWNGGAPRKDVATLTLTINGANDTPVLDLNAGTGGPGNTATFTEGGASVPLVNSAGVNLSDVDNSTFNKVTVSFDKTKFANAQEQLSIQGATSGGTFALNTIAAGSGTFDLGGVTYSYSIAVSGNNVAIDFSRSGTTLTAAQAEGLLEALRYSNSSENPTGGSNREFRLTVTDSGGTTGSGPLTSAAAISTITVLPVNDAPVLDLDGSAAGSGYTGSFRVGSGAPAAIADLDSAITDLDSSNLSSATIVLTNAKVGDSLAFSGTFGSITASVPPAASADGTMTLTLSGAGTLAQYKAAIEAIRFSATGTNYTDRVFNVTVYDDSVAISPSTGLATTSPPTAAALVSNTAIATLSVLPDTRALTVTGTTVNEASPYVLFSVGGVDGQRVTLELGNSGTASLGVDTANAGANVPLQYLNSSNEWVSYTPGTAVTMSGATLWVRTAVVNDALNEGAETLALIARNDAGGATTGLSTIKDDGTGAIYKYTTTTGNTSLTSGQDGYPVLDDDRPLTVNSVTVNEASPYAVFTVTGPAAGQPSQKVLLSLSNAGGDTPTEVDGGKANILIEGDYDSNPATPNTLPPLQYYSGSAWVTYDSNNPPSISGGGSLLVRVAITAERDTDLDGPEIFNLVATNTGGTSGMGAATIVDDGTGVLYTAANPTLVGGVLTPVIDNSTPLDDDRPLSISNVTVNEASPYAVFTVTGAPDQLTSLALAGQNGDGSDLNSLQYWDGDSWEPYVSGNVPLNTNGQLMVRVALSPEQETDPDGPETFRLVATNTGGSSTPVNEGVGTIKDDGTGSIYLGNNNTAVPNQPGDTDPNGPDYPAQLDDDRVLTVSNVTVNEGSPFAVFTVTGVNGQIVKLSLSDASGNYLSGVEQAQGAADIRTGVTPALPALQYYAGGVWKTYDASNPPKILDGTTLLVRVAISAEQETALDGPETFRLVATNTGGTPNISTAQNPQGVATIRDDGQGDYWIGDPAAPATPQQLVDARIVLDDDRPVAVTISSPTVNEASPYAVFTVTGTGAAPAGQLVSLSLAPGSAAANVDYLSKMECSADGGETWTLYSGGLVPLDSAGKLFVRVPIVNDNTLEPDETFNLTVTNTGGTSATGVATITDDGNGGIFAFDSSGRLLLDSNGQPALDEQAIKDDDRPLTIAPVTVNEASPFAVFTVSGGLSNPADQAGQLVKLNLANGSTSGLTGLQYYNTVAAPGLPVGWTDYADNSYVKLDANGKLLVRVAITPEQETLQDGPETFTLKVTNTGGSSTTGLGTVVDDGTGSYFAPNNNLGISALPANVRLDDDRPLTVGNITVNEGSPKAVFTVTGAPGQVALLELANVGGDPASDAIGGTAALGTTLPTLQYFDPSANNNAGAWVGYNQATPPVLTAAGNLLVRVSIAPESDGVFDGPETFQLRATNTGGSAGVGTATILDDGTGSYWIGDAIASATPDDLKTANIKLDDDRPITVVGGTYNEGSPRAVFTVTANAGQLLTLGVEDVQTSGLASAPLSYSVDGGVTWLPYTGAFVAGPVPVLVAVNITSERDDVYEVSEEFKLVVNPGLPTRAADSGFIVDDGRGDMYDELGSPLPSSAVRDDDRPRLQVEGPASPVSEGSPAVFKVSLSKTLLNDTPIDLTLTPGTASAGDVAMGDVFYLNNAGQEVPLQRAQDGRYIIPAGRTSFYVRTLTTQDSNYEGLERFRLVAILPENVGGDSSGADAGIIDDGTGVVYTGQVDPAVGLLVNTAARPDDDRPVAPLIEPAAAPAPSIMPPAPAPTAPAVHVMVAVAEGRQAVSSGATDSAAGAVTARAVSGGAGNTTLQKTDVLIDKFDRATDPNLFVLPEVKATRGQAPEATSQAYAMQSGLLVQELSPNTSIAVTVQVSQAPTSADQTLAGLLNLSDVPDTVDRLQVAELTEQERADMLARKQALHLSAAREAQRLESQTQASARGQFGFSKQLQMSAAKRQLVVPANLS